MPPEFNGTIKNENQFICKKGNYISRNTYNIDGTVNRNSFFKTYYTNSTTSLPMEILNTGNVDVLENYIKESKLDPDSREYKHLQERISVMRYFNELEEFNNTTPPVPVDRLEPDGKGHIILPGLVLDRPQSSGNGCWSCALSLILKGRGVNVSQELIRRFRPEYMEGLGPKSAEQTDTMNCDMVSEVFQYADLISKLCPNTLVKRFNKNGIYNNNKRAAKENIIKCLTEKHTPVAMCTPGHWVTIIGISADHSKVYIANSINSGGVVETRSLDAVTSARNVEFVWAESMELDPVTQKPAPNFNGIKFDPDSGAADKDANYQDIVSTVETHVKGTTVPDGELEVYVPAMVRDFTKSYEDQKVEYNNYKNTNKTLVELNDLMESVEFQGNKKYHYLSDHTYSRIQKSMDDKVNKALDINRRLDLKIRKKYPDKDIDKMTHQQLEEEFKKAPVAAPINQQQANKPGAVQPAVNQSGKKKGELDVKNPTTAKQEQDELEAAIKASLEEANNYDEDLKAVIDASLEDKNNVEQEDSELKAAIEKSLKEQKERDEINQPLEETNKTELENKVRQPEVKQPEAKQNEILQPEVKQSDAKQNEVRQPEVKQPDEKQNEVQKPEVKQEKQGNVEEDNSFTIFSGPSDNESGELSPFADSTDEELNKYSSPAEYMYGENNGTEAEMPGRDSAMAEPRLQGMENGESKKAQPDPHEEIYRRFNERLEQLEASDMSPVTKELENNLLYAQFKLSAALNGSKGVITEDCIEAGARLMTYVTLSDICKRPGVTPEMMEALTKPSMVEKCVKDMLFKKKGEEKGYAERVIERLCSGQGRDHVLTLENKHIYSVMISETKQNNPRKQNDPESQKELRRNNPEQKKLDSQNPEQQKKSEIQNPEQQKNKLLRRNSI